MRPWKPAVRGACLDAVDKVGTVVPDIGTVVPTLRSGIAAGGSGCFCRIRESLWTGRWSSGLGSSSWAGRSAFERLLQCWEFKRRRRRERIRHNCVDSLDAENAHRVATRWTSKHSFPTQED